MWLGAAGARCVEGNQAGHHQIDGRVTRAEHLPGESVRLEGDTTADAEDAVGARRHSGFGELRQDDHTDHTDDADDQQTAPRDAGRAEIRASARGRHTGLPATVRVGDFLR